LLFGKLTKGGIVLIDLAEDKLTFKMLPGKPAAKKAPPKGGKRGKNGKNGNDGTAKDEPVLVE
jgi:hypothetical protein